MQLTTTKKFILSALASLSVASALQQSPTTLKVPAFERRPTTTSTTPEYIENGVTGRAKTTRYFDSCKPACGNSWIAQDVANGTALQICDKLGNPLAGALDAQDGCIGGDAWSCTDQMPFAVTDELAYGFAAAYDTPWCGKCFELTFVDTAVKGKRMYIQIVNTGVDQTVLDLVMPHWETTETVGSAKRFGKYPKTDDATLLDDPRQCDEMPTEDLKRGCEFRFSWFKGADNPTATYREIRCPAEIVAKTGFMQK